MAGVKKKFKQTLLEWFDEKEMNIDEYWDFNLNTILPSEIGKGSEKKVFMKCKKCSYHKSYEIKVNSFTRGSRCNYCSHSKIHYFDSLGFLYHNAARMIVEDKRNNLTYEDVYNIAPFSQEKYYVKCLDCNELSDKKVRLGQLVYNGFSCRNCRNTISLPNRFIRNLLYELNEDFQTEWTPYWSEGKRYDVYLKNKKIIIEMDGGFHNNNTKYYSKIETLFIDRRKDYLAKKHNIEVIRIDCSYIGADIYSNEQKIIEETYFMLKDIFDINMELLNNIMDKTRDKDKVKCWELYNQGMDFKELKKYFNISDSCVREWCKLGNKLGKCSYTKEDYQINRKRKRKGEKFIICLNDKRIFESMGKASNFYNISINSISRSCNKKNYRPNHGICFKKINHKHNKTLRMVGGYKWEER